MATALFLTERDATDEDNKPKIKGRIITTIEKAKEVRPLVEKCITLARHALSHQEAADELEPNADRNSEQWRAWRQSDRWREWNRTIAPVVAARRRALRLLGDKQAVKILFDDIAPASPTARAATPACCGWPSRDWATPAPGRFWNWWARTIASEAWLPGRRSSRKSLKSSRPPPKHRPMRRPSNSNVGWPANSFAVPSRAKAIVELRGFTDGFRPAAAILATRSAQSRLRLHSPHAPAVR